MKNLLRWVLGYSKAQLKDRIFHLLDDVGARIHQGQDVSAVIRSVKRQVEDWLD